MNDKIALITELRKRGFESQVVRQKALISKKEPKVHVEPYFDFVMNTRVSSGSPPLHKVGALLLAGGVGSRLGFAKPKGCFPILNGKSLYEYAVEKIKTVGEGGFLAIMTSENTDAETKTFFEEQQFFGLRPTQVDFFVQESWPLLDEEGEPFFDDPDHLAMGPNGNGQALALFFRSPIFQKWRAVGIEHLALFPVDNPIADPFFSPWVTHHIESKAEVTLLVTRKRTPEEKMGVVALVEGRLAIVEYSEISSDLQNEYMYGNTGMILFSLSFIEKIARIELPIHIARKTSKKFTKLEGSREIIAYKFEQFIFDLLYYSDHSEAFVCDRARFFAPLKEWEGADGVESVQAALRLQEKRNS